MSSHVRTRNKRLHSGAVITGILCFAQSFYPQGLNAQSEKPTLIESNQELIRFELSVPAMGSHLDMVVYAPTEHQAKAIIEVGLAEIDRLSPVLSNYDSMSEIMMLCSAPSGDWTPISNDLAAVLSQSRRWYKLSDGKFDITVGPLTQLWRTSRKRMQLPSLADVADAKLRCGWKFVELDPDSSNGLDDCPLRVSLLKPKMMLDLSGLAVGYIVDAAFTKMFSTGARHILLNAGGDIRVGDAPPGSDGWKIKIAGLDKESPPLAMLRLQNCAVTTSGDLNQFVEIDGRRYSHFIDPDTGDPIERRQSVTAIAATTLDADAGATAMAVLGMIRSSELFESLPLHEAIFVVADQSDTEPIRMQWIKKK